MTRKFFYLGEWFIIRIREKMRNLIIDWQIENNMLVFICDSSVISFSLLCVCVGERAFVIVDKSYSTFLVR